MGTLQFQAETAQRNSWNAGSTPNPMQLRIINSTRYSDLSQLVLCHPTFLLVGNWELCCPDYWKRHGGHKETRGSQI